jgi:hypothetical protein
MEAYVDDMCKEWGAGNGRMVSTSGLLCALTALIPGGHSNSCVEIFNVLGIEAARAAIMKEERGVIEFDGSYVNSPSCAI